uniref:F-box domain-containing protein n=1 Tax=Triticum aestivum TaxID=4565 RepID=A0A077S482_WHEAT|nr:unnamed protein product [Triticum aestivum]
MAKRLSNEEAAVAGCEDRLSTLPEDVILRLLSFLPSRQAVRTCVLATRWRTLWKSVPALRIDETENVLSCQSLEVLEMELCIISIRTIFPKSLRHLRIRLTDVYPKDTRPLISAPGLITLELANCTYWTPLPKNLPSLVTAFINIGSGGMESCQNSLSGDCGYVSCEKCYGMDDECVFLEGLSGATNLQLISPCSMALSSAS